MKYLTPKSVVLDIGCNRGFFGIYLAPYIAEYIGIEHDYKELKYGIDEAAKRNLHPRIRYKAQCFEAYIPVIKFDVILSLAVYRYLKMTMHDFAMKMDGMLKPGGYIIQECHPVNDVNFKTRIHDLIPIIEGELGMRRIDHKIFDDTTWRGKKRDFYVWRKAS
jgi:cyclopropane fatty-acyl-phospholipid synthase-like methyltransferase